jgi:hypothetical protein
MNDVDLESLHVTGNDNVGILGVPLTGWALAAVKRVPAQTTTPGFWQVDQWRGH